MIKDEMPSAADCTDFVREFVDAGWDYCLLPVLRQPDYTVNAWRRDCPSLDPEARFGDFNVGIRRPDAFAIKVTSRFDEPLYEHPAYMFCRELDTLRFEAGEEASFVFQANSSLFKFGEHHSGEKTHTGPLKGSVLVYQSGVLGFGLVMHEMKTVRVTHKGTIQQLKDLPELIDALTWTGKFEETGFRL